MFSGCCGLPVSMCLARNVECWRYRQINKNKRITSDDTYVTTTMMGTAFSVIVRHYGTKRIDVLGRRKKDRPKYEERQKRNRHVCDNISLRFAVNWCGYGAAGLNGEKRTRRETQPLTALFRWLDGQTIDCDAMLLKWYDSSVCEYLEWNEYVGCLWCWSIGMGELRGKFCGWKCFEKNVTYP